MLAETTDWVRPRALRPGDRVGVAAPASVVDRQALARGVAELERLGFDVRAEERLFEAERFHAGSAERRTAELHALFEDETVAAIFCARGGAGVFSLLERLDAELIRAHPKALVGYSDVTFLQLLLARLRIVSFQGPMVARELASGRYDRDSLLAALSGDRSPWASAPDDLLPLREGVAEGRLLGGCLSILAAAAGTPWALRSDGPVLLFLEDVDEPPYRIERLLVQLRVSGALRDVVGVVLGEFPGCSPAIDAGYSLEQVILDALELEVPVALGQSSGHARGANVTLPLGVRARLECDGAEARLQVLEASVA